MIAQWLATHARQLGIDRVLEFHQQMAKPVRWNNRADLLTQHCVCRAVLRLVLKLHSPEAIPNPQAPVAIELDE